jgi:membrane-bound inhibitor of C-type lysozyme
MKKTLITILVLIIVLGGLAYWQYKNTSVKNVQPSIALISPNGGETLKEGSVYAIKWNTQNIPATNKVSISIRRVAPPALPAEGQEFDPIVFTDLENTGSKDWNVSYMYPDGNYMLGITSYASIPITDAISDESDATFQILNSPIAQAAYICDGGKTIQAAFYKGEEYVVEPGQPPIPSGTVKLILSDGRNFDLGRTISADGGRYANGEESFIFWDKGDTILILENGTKKDYKGCQVQL